MTELALSSLLELVKLETDTECRSNALEAICALICADEDDFQEGNIEIAKQTSVQEYGHDHYILPSVIFTFFNVQLELDMINNRNG